MATLAGTEDRPRKPSLAGVTAVAAVVFVIDALVLNCVFFSLLPPVIGLLVARPLSFLKRFRPQRRHILGSIGIFLGALALVVAMGYVNARIGPSHAQRLIDAIENYRAATGVYPQKLDDLVPKFIDHVPYAQYKLIGQFYYVRGAPTEALLWYNPHGMDHRGYNFKTKRWGYAG